MSMLELLKEEVSIYTLFDMSDPPVRYETDAKPCQISCPFHGKDKHPSARVYPDTNSFRCFFCSKSWNSVTYWAEANNWYTQNDKLDISRAIDDLCSRFGITNSSFDWQKKFYSIKKSHEDTSTPHKDKLRLLDYYCGEVSSMVSSIPSDQRPAHRGAVMDTWSELDRINLQSESWEQDLKKWYDCAKLRLHAQGV